MTTLTSRLLNAIIRRRPGDDVMAFYLGPKDYDTWKAGLSAREKFGDLHPLDIQYGHFLERPVFESTTESQSYVQYRRDRVIFIDELSAPPGDILGEGRHGHRAK